MSTDPKDTEYRPNLTDEGMLRRAQIQAEQDKIDALIDLATPEEPRPTHTPPSEEERQANRDVSQLESDIPLTTRLLWGRGYSWKWLAIPGLLALVLIFIAAIAFALLSRDNQTASPTPPPPPAAQNPAAPPPAAQNPVENPADAGAAPAAQGCDVDPFSFVVASKVTLDDKGVADPRMFVVQWDTGFINNSADPVLVTAKLASSDGAPDGAWDGTYTQVAAGASQAWPGNWVTNNAGGTAGATTFHYVKEILAVPDTPECAALLASPSDETAQAAIPADLPPAADVQLPNG